MLKYLSKQLLPPIIHDGLSKINRKLLSPLQTTIGLSSPAEQSLDIYWDDNMAQLLEKWGEDHVWNEIQMFLWNTEGKVLDVACGTGVTMKMLERYHKLDIYGCDISDLLIRKAVEKNIPKEKLIICDATKMAAYADNFFDYSYSIGSLEHFTEQGIKDFILENFRITNGSAFHMLPVSKSDTDEGWISPYQSYFNNSMKWWLEKFRRTYPDVNTVKSSWQDSRSWGFWFVCTK